MLYSSVIYHKEASVERADRAKIFWSGRSQAVRLPKDCRFEGTEVRIRRRGDAVILEPIPTDWRWLDELVPSGVDADLIEAVEDRTEDQERPALERLFD
jgi:antitoxin VapB